MEHDYEDIFDIEDLDPDELRGLVRETLRQNNSIDPLDINVHVRGDKVILTGRCGTDLEKRIAERVVGDRIGLVNVESQLVVDHTRRPEAPEAADEAIVQEQNDEGVLLGESSLNESDTAAHLGQDMDAAYYGTTDRMKAIEGGFPWSPPDDPTPEGTDEQAPIHDAEQDSF